MKNYIVVTGASGFIGVNFAALSRFKDNLTEVSVRKETINALSFDNVTTILHCAGKAHQMQKIDEAIFFTANRDLTYELAEKAKAQGAKHFIYLSSIKVYGIDSVDNALTEQSPCHPTDPYGKSKLEGEHKLLSLQGDSFIVSIIRPPLVYGAKVKGNVIKLLALADSLKPLPFANIPNKRSMVYVGNLIALIDKIIETQQGGIFIAGDEKPLSTSELVKLMRKELNRPQNLFTLPSFALKSLAFLKPDLSKRLFGSLVFDNTETNKILNFTPPYSIEAGVKEMVSWYQSLKIK